MKVERFEVVAGEQGRCAVEFSPDTVNLLSEEEINAHSRSAWEKLYAEVERLAGRHDPLVWGQFVADQFKRCKGRSDLFRSRPPHFMLRSVEANAANWRSGRNYTFSENRFRQVMLAYMRHNDPLLLSFAANDLTSMLLLMNREQIELQVQYNEFEAARIWLIFVSGNRLSNTSIAVKNRFGVTPLDWVRLCFVSYLLTDADPNSRATVQQIRNNVKQWINEEAIDAFVGRAGWKVEQLGQHYRTVRASTPLQFHSFIRSAFLESPMMDYGGGRLLAPNPELLFGYMSSGLYRMLGESWKQDRELRHEFSNSMEIYVGQVLGQCNKLISLSSQAAIKKLATAKSCDFLLETEDVIVLVESKGVAFERRLLFPKQMQEDSSTTRIIDAGDQLRQTYDDLRGGRFDTFVTDREKPVVAIIATYDEIPYANSDWYMQRVIIPRAGAEGRPLPSPTLGLPSRPVVMSLRVLEMFMITVNVLRVTPLDLFREKEVHNELAMGVWGDYLRRKLNDVKEHISPFPFIEDAYKEFVSSLIPHDQK